MGGHEHVEQVRSTWRTWRCFPVLQLRCALIFRELNQIFIAYLFKGGQEQSFFPSKNLIYGISRDNSKNFNIRTCEHMILGQLRIRARQTTYAALMPEYARVCQSMPEYARVCHSMPESCQVLPEYARVCQSMPEYAIVCQSLARVFQSMP